LREFDTGATRDTDEGKLDYEGFLSPLVLEEFGKYMNSHRVQADGKLRDSDNWQKGIPLTAYMKSGWRHFFDAWKEHRLGERTSEWMIECLCAVLFNVMGYLHEVLKAKAEVTLKFSDLKPGTAYPVNAAARKEPTMQEAITAVYDELAASRKLGQRWDEGCAGGMGAMAPSMSKEESIKSAALTASGTPNISEKL
jgi:hypothetical protein